ncbi:hypothetical protein THAOC_09776 [Thalassiosira oceanica]|uniref:Uncharacterized protein n=1 Tax=Thalassiosira oceanica TaxID=159749 RepID=K0SUC3_THAOC|nr:hypothetical protein THAOC_09776 [Thalassiosira oceanica]|eukprot:EJK69015.1 hypothetical protein THAOC_09776 [Thalassiosira oceanica]
MATGAPQPPHPSGPRVEEFVLIEIDNYLRQQVNQPLALAYYHVVGHATAGHGKEWTCKEWTRNDGDAMAGHAVLAAAASESDEGRTDAPTVRPRPGYRRRSIPGRLDPPRLSGDTGPFLVGSTVEDEGPPMICLASAAGGTPIMTPHVPAPPCRGSEQRGAID